VAGGGIDFHDADDLFYPNSQLNFDAPPIVSAARRRFKGEKVPHEEKVFSLFEPHTELIKKGKKDKPMEFGHLIFLTQTREKFITDCILYEKSPSETTMLPEVVERHEDQFGRKPLGIAMDKGCHPGKEAMEDLRDDHEDEVEFIGIPSRSKGKIEPQAIAPLTILPILPISPVFVKIGRYRYTNWKRKSCIDTIAPNEGEGTLQF